MSWTTTTATQYIAATGTATFIGALVNNAPPTKFVPMRRHVQTNRADRSHNVTLKNIDKINDYMVAVPTSLYYVRNVYEDEYFGHSVTLYGFTIIKETRCYYFLSTGQRVAKKLTGNTLALTPEQALVKAQVRANRYLDILIRRGIQVSNFIKASSHLRKPSMRELRDFEAIAKTFSDTDDIPHHLLKDNDPELNLKEPF